VANSKGAILTLRDKALLSYVGIARYATADQIHRLFFAGRSKKQTYRRLAKLCAPGGGLGQGACLRRLEFRRSEGTGVPVWALSSYGRGIAGECVPYLRPPAEHDIGHRFLEHTLLLNEVLVELVLKLRAFDIAPLSQLPFRWYAEDDSSLQFTRHVGPARTRTQSVLKPDAILEIPRRRRRLFLEAETGTQSIAKANPARSGAILVKVRRYTDFFIGRTERGSETWYRAAYPDGFTPRVVFLVHSKERKTRVEEALKRELNRTHHEYFKVFVFTFAEAASVLGPYIVHGILPGDRADQAERVVTVDEAKLRQLRESYIAIANVVVAFQRQAKELVQRGIAVQIPPVPEASFRVMWEFVQLASVPGPASPPSSATGVKR
jgi:hypothetical protein